MIERVWFCCFCLNTVPISFLYVEDGFKIDVCALCMIKDKARVSNKESILYV